MLLLTSNWYCVMLLTKGFDVKSMTDKVRFTYRPTEILFEKIAEEASRKGISINSEITNILWKYYFSNKTNNHPRR